MTETYVRFSPIYHQPGEDIEQRICRLEHMMEDLTSLIMGLAEKTIGFHEAPEEMSCGGFHQLRWREEVDPGDSESPADMVGWWSAKLSTVVADGMEAA